MVNYEDALLGYWFVISFEDRLRSAGSFDMWHCHRHLVVAFHLHRAHLLLVHAGWFEVIPQSMESAFLVILAKRLSQFHILHFAI